MEKKLPEEVEQLLIGLYTLIGESLIDERIENRENFENAQNEIGRLLKKHNVKHFEFIK